MIILSIETSCDETAVSIVRATGDFPHATYSVLGNALFSQIEIHREYGGVFPAVAKREHAKTLVPMLQEALIEADMLMPLDSALGEEEAQIAAIILQREPDLAAALIPFLETHTKPPIDMIAVTSGPGLEPTLWVGINFARILARIWNIPVVPVNHMEGHILGSILSGETIPELSFPTLAVLISGGHTELVLMKNWTTYELIGQTRDDAIGEAFDKVARMLGLPYPGGPEISKLAAVSREKKYPQFIKLPRPMLDSGDLDFSFSGLKTAVRYAIQGKDLTDEQKASIAEEFENAVTEVLLKKVKAAIEQHGIESVIVGGGVSANTHIRTTLAEELKQTYPTVMLYIPSLKLTTDNSLMIALAGHARQGEALLPEDGGLIKADGNRSLATTS